MNDEIEDKTAKAMLSKSAMLIKSNREPINILLVEDDPVDTMVIRRAFKKNKIQNPLHLATNGMEALTFLEERPESQRPKIIILDLNMPKMNGLDFLREMRKIEAYNSLLVFVLTTSKEDSDRVEAYGMNVSGYITKPLLFNDFVDQIKILSGFWNLLQFAD